MNAPLRRYGIRPFVASGLLSLLALLILGGCAALPDNSQRSASFAPTATETSYWGQRFADIKRINPINSGFVSLEDGLEAFAARAAIATRAQLSIDAQYYLWHDDLVGRLLLDELVEAAERGVRVRLLIDDIDLRGKDHNFHVLNTHPNFEIRVFNPFSRSLSRSIQYLTRFGSVTRRMHNKSFIVDNQIAVIGGRNIGNEYFEADPQITFGDLDAMAIGPVVERVSQSFDLYWNNDLAYPISTLIRRPADPQALSRLIEELNEHTQRNRDSVYIDALNHSRIVRNMNEDALPFFWGKARLFVDAPEKLAQRRDRTELRLTTQLDTELAMAEKELIVISPYFIPGRLGTEVLTSLAHRGVRVRVITNSLASNNHMIVHAKYAKYRKPLLEAGVEIYELRNQEPDDIRRQDKAPFGTTKSTVLHAKSFVIDRQSVFIGSLNFDPRSFVENTEVGVVFESDRFAENIGKWVDDEVGSVAYKLRLETAANGSKKLRWHDGESTTHKVEPDTRWWTRVLTRAMSWLPGESQL